MARVGQVLHLSRRMAESTVASFEASGIMLRSPMPLHCTKRLAAKFQYCHFRNLLSAVLQGERTHLGNGMSLVILFIVRS